MSNPNESICVPQQATLPPKASHRLAAIIGMEPATMLATIKAQCFRCDPAKVTNEQLAAFVSVAAEMGVNPFLPDMLFAFPGPGGSIIPIMGPSGVYKKLAEHPDVDSWETTVFPEDVTQAPTHATTKIWRKGSERPLSYTALVSEWKMTNNPNWNTRPRHMIGLRSLKHCARQLIHGLPYDVDDREIINITASAAPKASLATLIGAPEPTQPSPVTERAPGSSAPTATNTAAASSELPPEIPEVAP